MVYHLPILYCIGHSFNSANVKMVKSNVDIATVRYRGIQERAPFYTLLFIYYIIKYISYIVILLWTYRARTSPEKQFTR